MASRYPGRKRQSRTARSAAIRNSRSKAPELEGASGLCVIFLILPSSASIVMRNTTVNEDTPAAAAADG